jgi:hypothetical protein
MKNMEVVVFRFDKFLMVMVSFFSAFTFAGGMGRVCEVSDVTTPCNPTSWGIEGHALYLQAGDGVFQSTTQIETATGRVKLGLEPTWQWGFQVGATYLLDTGYDWVWSWSNYRNTNNKFILPNPANLGTLLQNNAGDLSQWDILTNVEVNGASINTTSEWDQINFEFGQHVNFSEAIMFRPHVDLQIVRVANYQNNTFKVSNATDKNTIYAQNRSVMFNGAGPRTGFELSWNSDYGLSLYGQGAFGLFYGVSKSNESFSDYNISMTSIYNVSTMKVVPSLDGKLGGKFHFDFADGVFSLDAGWLWQNYSSVFHVNMVSESNHDVNDVAFSIQGLYMGIHWIGSIA